MPTYDYLCLDCTHKFDHYQSIGSEPLTECPECGGYLKRLIGGGAGLIFRGPGFYCTDYRKDSVPREDGNSPKKDKSSD